VKRKKINKSIYMEMLDIDLVKTKIHISNKIYRK